MMSFTASIFRKELNSLRLVRPKLQQGGFHSLVSLCDRLHTLCQQLPITEDRSHLYNMLKVQLAAVV